MSAEHDTDRYRALVAELDMAAKVHLLTGARPRRMGRHPFNRDAG